MVTKLFFCIRRSFKGLKDGGYSVLYLYPHLKNFSSKKYLSGCNNEALTKDGKPLQDLLSGAFQVVHLLLLRPPPTFISLIIAPTLRFLSKVPPALISNSSDEQSTKPCSPTSLPPRPSISSLGCKVFSRPFQPHAINFQSNHIYNETHS